MRVLISGGAGFIGSHLADELLERGHRVRVLDALVPQVHGPERRRPSYLHPDVELQVGDVRDREAVNRALDGVDAVCHLAAAVGVGQSMYQIEEYTSTNGVGTAVLLECLARRDLHRLVVASSMSVYGEGLYLSRAGDRVEDARRAATPRGSHGWNPMDADGEPLEPLPTPEWKRADPRSVYALSKYDQEILCLVVGAAYHVPTIALRLFNVYGPRQALSNPYTGALAIFASRFLNGQAPLVYEDGAQRRDFVNVHDVARAFRLALESPGSAVGEVYNVGSGRSRSILEVARRMGHVLGSDVEPRVTGEFRVGDVRHCYADVREARRALGYQPQVEFEDGLRELLDSLQGQVAVDRVPEAQRQLAELGLLR